MSLTDVLIAIDIMIVPIGLVYSIKLILNIKKVNRLLKNIKNEKLK